MVLTSAPKSSILHEHQPFGSPMILTESVEDYVADLLKQRTVYWVSVSYSHMAANQFTVHKVIAESAGDELERRGRDPQYYVRGKFVLIHQPYTLQRSICKIFPNEVPLLCKTSEDALATVVYLKLMGTEL